MTATRLRWRADRRGRSLACVVLAVLWLAFAAACSVVSLGYASAPSLLAFRAADRFALDSDQAAAVRASLDDLHAWHRRTELPRLVRGLGEVQGRLDRPLVMADADWLVAEVQQRYRVTVARMIDQAAPLIPTLRTEQVEHLERQFAKRDREFAEKYVDAPVDRVRATRRERVEENVSDWLGPLSPVQRRWLAARVDALPVDYRAVQADNQRRQREMVAILKRAAVGASGATPVGAESSATALKGWATDWDTGRPAAYRAQVDAWLRGYKGIAVDLVNNATPAQKERLRERLRGYAADLGSLVEPARAAGL